MIPDWLHALAIVSLAAGLICAAWTIFPEKMFAVWVLDYIFAFVLGIAFQYFTIAPMRNLSPREGHYLTAQLQSK